MEKKSGNGMDFSPTAQFAKNVRTVVKCTECNKPRVLYVRQKISDDQYQLLQTFIDSIEYSCGVTFKNISDLSSLAISQEKNKSSEEINNLEGSEVHGENNRVARKHKISQIDNEEDIDDETDRNDENIDCDQEMKK